MTEAPFYEPHRGEAGRVAFRDLDELAAPGWRFGERAITTADQLAVGFGRILRGAGLAVPLDTLVTFAAALDAVGLTDRDSTYWAARATLVRRPEDLEVFDRAFKVFWERRSVAIDLSATKEESIAITVDDDDDSGNDDSNDAERHDGPSIHLRFSAAEVLRDKDFAAYSDSELDEAHRLMMQLKFVGSRRREPAAGHHPPENDHARHASDRALGPQVVGRADSSPLPCPWRPHPPVGPAARRVGIDGTVPREPYCDSFMLPRLGASGSRCSRSAHA